MPDFRTELDALIYLHRSGGYDLDAMFADLDGALAELMEEIVYDE